MSRNVILTVGNSLMGDDAAGPLLGELLAEMPAMGWDVVDGGSTPETEVRHVRALRPDCVLVVDAAEMDLPPGEFRLVDDDIIAERFFMTTHAMPLTFLMTLLREFVADVRLLGIQPSLVAFYYPLSPEVKQAVERIHRHLREGPGLDAFERL
ncbi:MAG: hydrogenase maturation peptidase HycI [Methylocella sp.]